MVFSKVLVIDDEPLLLKILTRLLEKLGLNADTASDGAMGIATFKKNKMEYQLIILDYNLPGIKCEEIITTLKTLQPTSKILISTGFSAEEMMEKLGALGIAGVLQKPFNLKQLETQLREINVLKINQNEKNIPNH